MSTGMVGFIVPTRLVGNKVQALFDPTTVLRRRGAVQLTEWVGLNQMLVSDAFDQPPVLLTATMSAANGFTLGTRTERQQRSRLGNRRHVSGRPTEIKLARCSAVSSQIVRRVSLAHWRRMPVLPPKGTPGNLPPFHDAP